MLRDLVLAGGRVLLGQVAERGRQVHGRVPAHVGHVHEQHVDRGRDRRAPHWRSPCASGRGPTNGASQLKALSMRCGVPAASTSRSSGPGREAQMRPRQRLASACTSPGLPRGLRNGRRQLRDRAPCSGSRPGNRSSPAGSAGCAGCGRCGSRWRGPRCRAWHACRPAGRSSCRGGGRPSRSRGCRA